MNLYEQLNKIFPYLVSIRKLEEYISIDIDFPITWKLPKKYIDENKVVEQKTNKQDTRRFSFATEFNEVILNDIFSNINNIIKYNLDREAKENLFENKVLELKMFFDNNELPYLQDLEFRVKKDDLPIISDNKLPIVIENGEERENNRVVSTTARERQNGVGKGKEKISSKS